MSSYAYDVRSGPAKTALLQSLGESGACDGYVRATALALVRSLSPWQHRERLERIHRFICALPFAREGTEDFRHPVEILRSGGDCDDHTLIAVALCWSLKYPVQVWPARTNEDGWPGHYAVRAGYPEAETTRGDARTRWLFWETTLPSSRAAGFGAVPR